MRPNAIPIPAFEFCRATTYRSSIYRPAGKLDEDPDISIANGLSDLEVF